MRCICGQSLSSSFAERLGKPTLQEGHQKIWVLGAVASRTTPPRWLCHIYSTGRCIHSLMVTNGKLCETPDQAETAALALAKQMIRPIKPQQLTLW